jgi:hypothetical protein
MRAGLEAEVPVSRTEKTQPYWVKRFQHYREKHDHRKGYCDLPASPRAQIDIDFRWQTDCHYDCDWNHPIYRCGCGMCGWPSQSKELRRADRRAIKEGLDDYYEGRD